MIKNFKDLLEKAQERKDKKYKIAVVWPTGKDIFQAIKLAQGEIAEFVIIGKGKLMKEEGSNILSENPPVTIIGNLETSEEAVRKAMQLASMGTVDIVMKGNLETKLFLKAALDKKWDLVTKVLSHVAIFEIPDYDRLIFITDAGVCLEPDLMQKEEIIKNAVKVAHKLGIEVPKVAILSANEKINPALLCSMDAAYLVQMQARGQIVDSAIVDGPLALDTAVSFKALISKKINSSVQGEADILIVPDVVSGNMLAKSLIYFAKAKMAGVIMGAKIPLIVASRAGSAEEQLMSIALGILLKEENNVI